MGDRSLLRMGLPQAVMDACRKNRYETSKDVLSRTRGELVHALELSTDDIDHMMDTICGRVSALSTVGGGSVFSPQLHKRTYCSQTSWMPA